MTDKSENEIGIIGIGSITLGVISLFLGGIISCIVGFAAVATGFLGVKKHQIFSQTGMIIGAVSLIFFNLVSIGIVKAPLSVATGKTHLADSIYASINAFEILKQEETGDDEKSQMIRHLNNGLWQAALVNIDEIDRQVSGFKSHYQSEFIPGMKLMTQGYENDDLSKKIQGGALLDKWGQWNNANNHRLDKIKEPAFSPFYFAKSIFTD